jgi:hypothetical protein
MSTEDVLRKMLSALYTEKLELLQRIEKLQKGQARYFTPIADALKEQFGAEYHESKVIIQTSNSKIIVSPSGTIRKEWTISVETYAPFSFPIPAKLTDKTETVKLIKEIILALSIHESIINTPDRIIRRTKQNSKSTPYEKQTADETAAALLHISTSPPVIQELEKCTRCGELVCSGADHCR